MPWSLEPDFSKKVFIHNKFHIIQFPDFVFENAVAPDKNNIFIISWCVANEVGVKSWIE